MKLAECSLAQTPRVEVLASVYIVLIIYHSSCECVRFVADSYIRMGTCILCRRDKHTCFFGTGDLSSHNPGQSCDCNESSDVQEWACSLAETRIKNM